MSLVTSVRVLLSRLLDVLFRNRRDGRLSEEIETHLHALTDEYLSHGMTAFEARQAAPRIATSAAFRWLMPSRRTSSSRRGCCGGTGALP